MNNLEAYFQGEYKQDAVELSEIDEVIQNTLPTFVHAFNDKEKSWPYKIKDGKSAGESKENNNSKDIPYSTSTNSMILTMMKLAKDQIDREYIFPKIPSESIFNALGYKEVDFFPQRDDDNRQQSKWEEIINEAKGKYILKVCNGKKFNLESKTYGKNDPLSLLWCWAILEEDKSTHKEQETPEDSCDKTREKLVEIVKEKSEKLHRNDILDFGSEEGRSGNINELNKHSFISLKLLQFIGKVDKYLDKPDKTIDKPDKPLDKVDNSIDRDKIYFGSEDSKSKVKKHTFNFFEHRLHLHLSYSEIPDSRFDPAELIFSLEGALLAKGNAGVSSETIERVFQVIEKSQNLTPYFRPVNPIYATPQGQILLPLSVEVANSMLRICALLDSEEQSRECPFSTHSGMFRRYFRWLKAQVKKIGFEKEPCWGWTSEHVGGDDEIHLFQTSEILCFLINYRHMLQNRIARRSLSASGLKVDYPKREPKQNKKSRYKYWQEIVEPDFEPLLELPDDSAFKIYNKIGTDFIKPWDSVLVGAPAASQTKDAEGGKAANSNVSENDKKFSILLYGPPGTGKSTVGENIAKALGWKYITVTPSDFLAGGSAEVEARAKFIFNCLEEQKESVILFDEIDHFLLDRESDEYKKQTGIFQFMTPGMLPKINDLRKKKRSIFIIATNYEDRIDPAIKRLGRIDYIAPLMPPAYKQRKSICNKLGNGSEYEGAEEFAEKIQKMAGFTFGDIKTGAEKASITLVQYSERIRNIKNIEGLRKEFFLLYMIYNQQSSDEEGFKIAENFSKFIKKLIKPSGDASNTEEKANQLHEVLGAEFDKFVTEEKVISVKK